MFRFTRKPSSGSHSQYLAKITHLVQCGYIELEQDIVSVMAALYDPCGMCAVPWLPDDGFLVNQNMLEQLSLL